MEEGYVEDDLTGSEEMNLLYRNKLKEDEIFDIDPLSWVRNNFYFKEHLNNSNVITVFEGTYKRVKRFFDNNKFKKEKSLFHSHFLHSDDQDFRIVVLFKN